MVRPKPRRWSRLADGDHHTRSRQHEAARDRERAACDLRGSGRARAHLRRGGLDRAEVPAVQRRRTHAALCRGRDRRSLGSRRDRGRGRQALGGDPRERATRHHPGADRARRRPRRDGAVGDLGSWPDGPRTSPPSATSPPGSRRAPAIGTIRSPIADDPPVVRRRTDSVTADLLLAATVLLWSFNFAVAYGALASAGLGDLLWFKATAGRVGRRSRQDVACSYPRPIVSRAASSNGRPTS